MSPLTTFIRLCFLILFGVFFACIGAGIENHRAKLHATDPVALVVVGQQGALIVTKDGTVTNVESPEAALTIANALPEGHVVGVHVKCVPTT